MSAPEVKAPPLWRMAAEAAAEWTTRRSAQGYVADYGCFSCFENIRKAILSGPVAADWLTIHNAVASAVEEMLPFIESYAECADGDDPVHEMLPRWRSALLHMQGEGTP